MAITKNTKTIWWILGLAVVGGAAVAYFYAPKTPENVSENQVVVPSPLVIQGTVTGVNVDTLQITIQTSTTSPAKTVTISSITKIGKILSQKNASGVVGKEFLIEVNVSEVKKGSLVTISYRTDTDNVLREVDRITFTVEANIDAYIKSLTRNAVPYLKGQVVAIDIAGKNLTYNPYVFNTLSTTTKSVAIPDGIQVYRVDDQSRISILHARTAAALADIQPSQTIFIGVDPLPLKTGKKVPQAFIISEK